MQLIGWMIKTTFELRVGFELISNFCVAHARNKRQSERKKNLIRAHFLELFSFLLILLLHLNKKKHPIIYYYVYVVYYIIFCDSFVFIQCLCVFAAQFQAGKGTKREKNRTNFEKLCSFHRMCICAVLTHLIYFIFSVVWRVVPMWTIPIFVVRCFISYRSLRIRKVAERERKNPPNYE